MILEKFIARLIPWQLKTYGPGKQVKRYTDHIIQEVGEVLKDPNDLEEWMDIIILALGGAARQGYNAWEIVECLNTKLETIMLRKYPDWRKIPNNEIIQHLKENNNE